jgi:hypothetical protein
VKRWLVALLVAAFGSGCSVASLEDGSASSVHNKCSADSECGGGVCDAGACKAPAGQFGTLLFEVTAPANAAEFAGVGFLIGQDISQSGGDLNIALGSVAKVHGSATPTAASYANCDLSYGDIASATAPVKLTFTPSARLLGLPVEKYVVKSTKNTSKGSYEFKANIPPDDYEVYVEPDLESGAYLPSSCPVAPQIVHVSVEPAEVTLNLTLAAPSQLELDVLWPISQNIGQQLALQDWAVDMLDPTSGRVISAPATLEATTAPTDPNNQHFTASVQYTALPEGAGAGSELVRIKPPEGVVAPTLVMDRGALEALTPGKAKVDQLEQLPQPVVLDELTLVDSEGARLDLDNAAVRFVSTKLDIAAQPGTQAFFERTEQAQGGVVASVELLPGEYDVYVAPPPDSGFATTTASLTVGTSGPAWQGGKTVTMEPVSDVGGSVLTPGGEAAEGATVFPIASPATVTPLQAAVGSKPFPPLAESGIVGADAQFSLRADPGAFDLSIRPAEGSGFAWLVRPNVEVQSGSHDLGEMTLPLPVVYQGVVTVPGGVLLPGAKINAYLFLDAGGYTADRSGASSVVQVGEARAGDDGSFQLFLPSHLN